MQVYSGCYGSFKRTQSTIIANNMISTTNRKAETNTETKTTNFYHDIDNVRKLCDLLRSSEGPPVREALLMGKRVHYLKGEKLVNFLSEPKKGSKWPLGFPRFHSRHDAISLCRELCKRNFIIRSEKLRKGELVLSRIREFDEVAYFTWLYEGDKTMDHLLTTALIVGFILCVCFPIWPIFLRKFVWYLPVTLLLFIFFLITARAALFLFVWIIGFDCWFLPNLFDERLSFVDSLKPLYSFQPTKSGQLPYRIGVGVGFFTFCYWAMAQPSNIGSFELSQRHFLNDLYDGTFLSDISQKDKENIDKPKIQSIEDLLRSLDTEEGGGLEEEDFEDSDMIDSLLDKLVDAKEDIVEFEDN